MARAPTYWAHQGVGVWAVSPTRQPGRCFRVVWPPDESEPRLDAGDRPARHRDPEGAAHWGMYLAKLCDVAQWSAHVDTFAGRLARASRADKASLRPGPERIEWADKIFHRPLTFIEHKVFCTHYARVVAANLPSKSPPPGLGGTYDEDDEKG